MRGTFRATGTRWPHLLAAAWLVVCMIWVFLPILLNPGRMVPHVVRPPFPGEPYGVLAIANWFGETLFDDFSMRSLPHRGAPFGADYSQAPVYPLLGVTMGFLARVFGQIAAYNVLILGSFLIAGITMYALAYYLARSVWAAVVAGTLYAFSAYHQMISLAYLGEASIQWLPLYVLMLLRIGEGGLWRAAGRFAVALFLLFSFSYYQTYFMVVFTLLYLGIRYWYERQTGAKDFSRVVGRLAVGVGLTFCIVLPVYGPVFKKAFFSRGDPEAVQQGFVRPESALYRYSARPLEYLMPSEFNPIAGRIAEKAVSRVHDGGRHYFDKTVYLGFLPLGLAAFGVIRWRRTRDRDVEFPIILFTVTGLAAVFFSLAPHVSLGVFEVPTGSALAYQVFPMFRYVSRFGLVAILSVAVLAAVGFRFLEGRIRSDAGKWLAAFGLGAVILVEHAIGPPYQVKDMTVVPGAYHWLASEPGDFLVAEYPMDPSGYTVDDFQYAFYQRVHRKRIVNGSVAGSDGEAFLYWTRELTAPGTTTLLATLGVRYAFVHKHRYAEDELKRIGGTPGLALEREFEDILAYRVVEKAADHAFTTGGFYRPETWAGGEEWRWMAGRGKLFFYLPAGEGRIDELSLEIEPLGPSETVAVSVNGRDAGAWDVARAHRARIVLRDVALVSGLNQVVLQSSGGLRPIGEVRGNDDRRPATIAVGNLRYEFRTVRQERGMRGA